MRRFYQKIFERDLFLLPNSHFFKLLVSMRKKSALFLVYRIYKLRIAFEEYIFCILLPRVSFCRAFSQLFYYFLSFCQFILHFYTLQFLRKKFIIYYYRLTNMVYRSSPSYGSFRISTEARTKYFFLIPLIFHLYSHPPTYSKPAVFNARFQ